MTEWAGADELRPLLTPVGELAPHPSNPRIGNVEAIRQSLRRFGQQRPILALPDGTLVAGHHVHRAATDEDWTHVAVIRSDLTGDEITAYLLADNRTSDMGYYDEELLAARLTEIGEIHGTGYSDADRDALIASLAVPDGLMQAPAAANLAGQPLALGTATEFHIVLTYERAEHEDMVRALDRHATADETYADVILRLLEARA